MVLLTKKKGREEKRALFQRQEGTGLAPASRTSGFDIGVHRAPVEMVLLQERVWRWGPHPGSAVPCCVTVEGWLTLSGPASLILVKGNLMSRSGLLTVGLVSKIKGEAGQEKALKL